MSRQSHVLVSTSIGRTEAFIGLTTAEKWAFVAGLLPQLSEVTQGQPLRVGLLPLDASDVAFVADVPPRVARSLLSKLTRQQWLEVDERGCYALTRHGRLMVGKVARVRGLTFRDAIPVSTKRAVEARDNGICQECGCSEGLEFDHIVPWSKGGSHDEENVQLLCAPCNRAKAAR